MTLRVKLEIIPHGDESRAYEIHRLDISNLGYTEVGQCEYMVLAFDTEGHKAAMLDENIVHQRDLGPWALAHKAIGEVLK
jgi:hypothetical protein